MVTPKSFPPPAEAFAWMQQAGVFFPFVVVESAEAPDPVRRLIRPSGAGSVSPASGSSQMDRRLTEARCIQSCQSCVYRRAGSARVSRVLRAPCTDQSCRWAKAAPLQICNRYGVLPEGGCCILVPRVATGGRGW